MQVNCDKQTVSEILLAQMIANAAEAENRAFTKQLLEKMIEQKIESNTPEERYVTTGLPQLEIENLVSILSCLPSLWLIIYNL